MAEQPSLDGPLARIDRADELIVDLEGALQASLAGRPYSVEERPDENQRARAFVVTSLREIHSDHTSSRARSRIIYARGSTFWPISSS
jgi:hypothetical protein